MLIFYTGAIRTGKTTTVSNVCADRPDVSGFVTPDNELGKRVMRFFPSSETIEFETESSECVEIGRFKFSKTAFARGNELISQFYSSQFKFLVIDELGRFELVKRSGFYEAFKNLKLRSEQKAIVIVREELVEQAINEFGGIAVRNKEELERAMQ
ncbi:Conserved_hypothetical protein [Hexamita inflata]|uniref:NTPase n=1 Tax=Hexamita inflata TaxID=28002 RepID=A0AA86RAR0_9EUKA|nr:Conserved hypothetical protein [Hexamita inflata]